MNNTRNSAQSVTTLNTEQVPRASQFEYPIAATLTKTEVCTCMEDTGILPSVTLASAEDAFFVADSLIDAGIPIIEIGMNDPDAIDVISSLVRNAPQMIVGGGNVRNADTARRCVEAGAKFLCTDGLFPRVMEFVANENIAIVAGALTLTEVIAAWDSGADFVKVLPCYAVGGHHYIRTLKASIPQARLIAAGGVNQLTALKYVMEGVAALNVGNELIPTEAIALRQTRRIQELARRFLAAVDNGRI